MTRGTRITKDCKPPSGQARGKNLYFDGACTYSHAFDAIDAQLFNNIDDPINPGYTYGTSG